MNLLHFKNHESTIKLFHPKGKPGQHVFIAPDLGRTSDYSAGNLFKTKASNMTLFCPGHKAVDRPFVINALTISHSFYL